MAKARIEKTCVMHAKLAHHGQIGRHLGGVVGGDGYGLAADKDVKGTRIKDDLAVGGTHFLPKVAGGVMGDPVKVDDTGMGFGAVAQKIALGGA